MVRQLSTLEGRVASLPFCHSLAYRQYHPPSEKVFSPEPGDEVLSHRLTLGLNARGHHHVCWDREGGLFAHAAGCEVVVEDLLHQRQRQLKGHTFPVTVLALAKSGRRLASASGVAVDPASSAVLVWDVHANVPTLMLVLEHHFAGVQCLAFTDNDAFLLTVGNYLDQGLAVWDTVTGRMVVSCELPCTTNVAGWLPGSTKEFVTGGEGRDIYFWSVEKLIRGHALKNYLGYWPVDAKERSRAPSPEDGVAPVFHVTALAFDGRNGLAVGSNNGMIAFFDLVTNSCVSTLASKMPTEIDLLHWGDNRLAVAGVSPFIEIFPMRGSESLSFPLSSLTSSTLRETLDGAATAWSFGSEWECLVGTSAGSVVHVNLLEDTLTRVAAGHSEEVVALAFSADEQMFASCSLDGTGKVWNGYAHGWINTHHCNR